MPTFLPSFPCHGKIFFPADNLLFLLLSSCLAFPTVNWRNLFLFPTQARTENIHTHTQTFTYAYTEFALEPMMLSLCLFVRLSAYPFVTNNHTFPFFSFLSFLLLTRCLLADLEYFLLSRTSIDFVPSCVCSLFMTRLPRYLLLIVLSCLCVLVFFSVFRLFFSLGTGKIPEGKDGWTPMSVSFFMALWAAHFFVLP